MKLSGTRLFRKCNARFVSVALGLSVCISPAVAQTPKTAAPKPIAVVPTPPQGSAPAPQVPVQSNPLPSPHAAIAVECAGGTGKSDAEAAYGAFVAGKTSFDEGEYEQAVVYYKDSYRRDCTKVLLLDHLSRAYELKGDYAKAADTLDVFVKRSAPGDAMEFAKRRSAKLREKAAQREADVQAQANAPGKIVVERVLVKETASTPWPWIFVGGGVAFAAGGTILLATGLGKVGDVHKMCPESSPGQSDTRVCLPGVDTNVATSMQSEGRTLAAVGSLVIGLGVASIAGGIVWALANRSSTSTQTARSWTVTPLLGPGSVGASGTF